MTARERLRRLAQWLDDGGRGFDGPAKDAETAFLRALADRIDAEEAWAAESDDPRLRDTVTRLDANPRGDREGGGT